MCETCLAHREWREAVEKLSPPSGRSNVMPKGYLSVEAPISDAVAAAIKQKWDRAQKTGETVILGPGIKFVPFETHSYDPAIVICSWCGRWAAVQTECPGCGHAVI